MHVYILKLAVNERLKDNIKKEVINIISFFVNVPFSIILFYFMDFLLFYFMDSLALFLLSPDGLK